MQSDLFCPSKKADAVETKVASRPLRAHQGSCRKRPAVTRSPLRGLFTNMTWATPRQVQSSSWTTAGCPVVDGQGRHSVISRITIQISTFSLALKCRCHVTFEDWTGSSPTFHPLSAEAHVPGDEADSSGEGGACRSSFLWRPEAAVLTR